MSAPPMSAAEIRRAVIRFLPAARVTVEQMGWPYAGTWFARIFTKANSERTLDKVRAVLGVRWVCYGTTYGDHIEIRWPTNPSPPSPPPAKVTR